MDDLTRKVCDCLHRQEEIPPDLKEEICRYRGEIEAYLGGLCPGEEENLTGEVFERVLKHLHTFKGKSSLRTWIYHIAANVAYTFLGKRGRIPIPLTDKQPDSWESDPGDQEEQELGEPVWVAPAEDPAKAVERQELQRALEEAMAQLPPGERTVVAAWLELEGRECGEEYGIFADIGRMLGISRHVARKRFKRAMKSLKKPLRDWR